jgi:hypothetical protein
MIHLAAGVTPTAAHLESTAARHACMWSVGHLGPSLIAANALVFGEAVDDSSTGLWSVAAPSSADEVDRRAAAWGPADLPNKGG